jgi:transcriptional regulator with XRE-family HTH domain
MLYETILLHEAIRLLLISFRQQRRHTQRSLSIESGISRQFISQLECGDKQPSIDTLSQLSMALKTNISTLMVELDRIYQHLFWQQHSKEIAQDMPTSEPMAAESTDPSREYVRKAGGLDKP